MDAHRFGHVDPQHELVPAVYAQSAERNKIGRIHRIRLLHVLYGPAHAWL